MLIPKKGISIDFKIVSLYVVWETRPLAELCYAKVRVIVSTELQETSYSVESALLRIAAAVKITSVELFSAVSAES